jgi:hypothetical protein
MLATPAPGSIDELHSHVATAAPGRDRGAVATVLEALVRERLVNPIAPAGSIS